MLEFKSTFLALQIEAGYSPDMGDKVMMIKIQIPCIRKCISSQRYIVITQAPLVMVSDHEIGWMPICVLQVYIINPFTLGTARTGLMILIIFF